MDRLRASRVLALSERVYRLLLRAYPRAFREEYAAEMLLAFRDACREAARERGPAGALALWRDVAHDLVTTVCAQHVHRWMGWVRQALALALARQGHLAAAAPLTLQVAQRTDTGRVRATNEDSLLALVPRESRLLRRRGALFAVADGLGGCGRGDVASELAVRLVKDHYYRDIHSDLPAALRQAVQQAGATIYRTREAQRFGGAAGLEMGATCVAAALHERALYVANVGDSRAYVLHAGRLRQVTRDHSVVAQMVERGELTAAEARRHPQRSLIYRALGLPDSEADLYVEPVEEGDTVILCTDGLCGVVEDDELCAIVTRGTPAESVRRLVACANARGGPDNVTAIVVQVAAGA